MQTHIILNLTNLRSLESIRREWVSYFLFLCQFHEDVKELIVDLFVNVDSRTGTTTLTVIEEDTETGPGCDEKQVVGWSGRK